MRTAIIGLLLLAACSSPTEPLHDDVDLARQAWLAQNVSDYRFQVAMQTSWTPKSGFYSVRVIGKQLVEARYPSGDLVPSSLFTLTLDRLWDSLLAAREKGELNSALFDRHGVPIETDMGPWPVDGGVHYTVRGFRAGL